MGHSSEFAPRGHPRLPSSLVSEAEPIPSALIKTSSFALIQLEFEAIASLVVVVLNSIMMCKPVSLREQFATQAMAELGMCKYVFLTSGGRAVGGHMELERDGCDLTLRYKTIIDVSMGI